MISVHHAGTYILVYFRLMDIVRFLLHHAQTTGSHNGSILNIKELLLHGVSNKTELQKNSSNNVDETFSDNSLLHSSIYYFSDYVCN